MALSHLISTCTDSGSSGVAEVLEPGSSKSKLEKLDSRMPMSPDFNNVFKILKSKRPLLSVCVRCTRNPVLSAQAPPQKALLPLWDPGSLTGDPIIWALEYHTLILFS